MKKYIYNSKNVRCRIRYVKYLKHFELQIQERRFYVFWVNVFRWMTVREGFFGESDDHPILKTSYQCGNNAEALKTGTLNIEIRVKEFFREYFQEQKNEADNIKQIKSLL